MNCENCNIEHNGLYGSGRFCSSKCARGFSTKAKRQEINEKARAWNLKNRPRKYSKIKCKICDKQFSVRKGHEYCKYCCNQCRLIGRKKSLSKIMKKLHKQGKIKRWNINGKPSYAEKFFMGIFKDRNISYYFNYKVDRYFIDFAFPNKKVALEIDGKQHEQEDRKKHDQIRDLFLIALGWKVYRIKWKSIKSDFGKTYIENEINNFLALIV